MHLVNYENLRSFYIEYQDRILYGSDFSSQLSVNELADRFVYNFSVLETDQMIMRGKPIKGLDLPKEVLEKIYYKNALRLYPGLKELMGIK